MPARHLIEGIAGAGLGCREADSLNQLVVGLFGHHHAREECFRPEHAALAARTQTDLATERDQAKRYLGAGIGMSDGAADCAARTRLVMAEPGQGGRQQRLLARKARSVQQRRLPNPGWHHDHLAFASDLVEPCDTHDVDEHGGLGEPHVQHRQQRLTASDDARLGAVLGERRQGLVKAFGAEIVEGCGLHARLPNRRAKKPGLLGAALRASAAKNWPMIALAAPSSRRPPIAATLPPTAAS